MSSETEGSRSSRVNTGPHRFEMDGWISCAPFERLLNMEILEAADGRALLKMPFLIDFAQGGGLLHGGALIGLADTAVVMAIKSLVPPKTHFGTISMEARFLRPVERGFVTAEARVTGRKERLFTGEATVYSEEDKPVLEFKSVFKVARRNTIEKVRFGSE